eukprot:scaffold51266_cov69-Phaeocystis_antarctica.AAC.3
MEDGGLERDAGIVHLQYVGEVERHVAVLRHLEHVAVVLAGWLLEELRHRLLACPRKRRRRMHSRRSCSATVASLHVKAKLSKVSMAKKPAR